MSGPSQDRLPEDPLCPHGAGTVDLKMVLSSRPYMLVGKTKNRQVIAEP